MWRKSTKTNTGNCVEVRGDLAALRDSKDPNGPRLATPRLTTFLKGIKDGRFDRG
ncbi:DUF397 domain-containing protein [Actinophytocola sp.]|uniref:DUF397 domain-containing protein n=1 Tax=Actinophytocola sp. TaxID=1872138 RepID=UPI002ED23F01